MQVDSNVKTVTRQKDLAGNIWIVEGQSGII